MVFKCRKDQLFFELLLDLGGEILLGSADVAVIHLGYALSSPEDLLKVGNERIRNGNRFTGIDNICHGGRLGPHKRRTEADSHIVG